ncbi:MAG: 30S ribosomal protein S19 [Planctomycetota bacterium]
MSRSIKKGPYVDAKLAKKVEQQLAEGKNAPITTWARACTVIPGFVGRVFMVHDGHKHIKVQITEDMVGHKLGEFAPTRIFRGHTNKKEAQKNR